MRIIQLIHVKYVTSVGFIVNCSFIFPQRLINLLTIIMASTSVVEPAFPWWRSTSTNISNEIGMTAWVFPDQSHFQGAMGDGLLKLDMNMHLSGWT